MIRKLQDHPLPYVTASDLADYWKVSRKQIYKQIGGGRLKAVRFGPRLFRISTADAIEFERSAKMTPDAEKDSKRADARTRNADERPDRRRGAQYLPRKRR